jgi:hypothetical protein
MSEIETPPPQPPQPPRPSRLSRLRESPRAAWIGGGLALLLVLLGITAAVAGTGGRSSTSGSPTTADTGSGSPSSRAAAGAAKPGADGAATGPSARGGPGQTAVASAVPLTHPSTRLAPRSARDAAAAVLIADDTHYRRQLAAGERLLGDSGFAAWASGALADTAARSDTARAEADFNASDQPAALIPWRADNGQAADSVRQFARDGAHEASIATRTDATNALADLTDADQLAGQVRAGA